MSKHETNVEKFERISDEHGIPRKHVPAAMGHNRVGNVAVDELRTILQRIEKLTEEKQAIQGDITDVYGEAKGRGFDTRAIKAIVKIRKMDAKEVEEQETIIDVYKRAMGMIPELDDND